MGYTAPNKKAIKDAIKAGDTSARVLDFYRNVQETSLFGMEQQVPGTNTVVGPDAYTDRRWYATLTVDERGTVVGIK